MKNKDLKRRIIEISYKLKLSHLGSCLTAVDIIKEIYEIKKPDEKFVLSAGHAHLAHAVVMEHYGIIKDAEKNIEEHGIHCERAGGCDASTGSLGQGLPIAVGMALARKDDNIYCLISDGECSEGSIYEALRIAQENNLAGLKVYLNMNGMAAYKQTFPHEIIPKLKQFWPELFVRYTNFNELMPVLTEPQEAHYKVLSKEEYETLIR